MGCRPLYEAHWQEPLPITRLTDEAFERGSLKASSAHVLRRLLLEREWTRGTKFEIARETTSGGRQTSVCFHAQLLAWDPGEAPLPRSLPIQFATPRSELERTFDAMLVKALTYAVDRELLDVVTARDIRRVTLIHSSSSSVG